VSYVTLNDEAVMSARITLPRWGVWHADLVLPDSVLMSGAAELEVGGAVSLRGTVFRAGNTVDGTMVRVVGGYGGFQKVAKPAHYSQTPIETPLRALLVTAGERLHSAAHRTVLSRVLPSWTTMARGVGLCVGMLVGTHPGAVWRVLPDGSVWVGEEEWIDSELEYDVLAEDPGNARISVFAERPSVFPGETVGGRRVSLVQHQFNADALRTELWFED
jgi:hypothetical protein